MYYSEVDGAEPTVSIQVKDIKYTFTNESLTRLIEEKDAFKLELAQVQRKLTSAQFDVREFFQARYETDHNEIVAEVDDVNNLLVNIGSEELTRSWSATVNISVTVTGLEAPNAEAAEEIIKDSIDVNFTSEDRYGRPLIVPPSGGKAVAYTRATTIANSLDDASALVAWKMRMAAIGLTTRPDILLSISAAQEDKMAVNSLIEDAMQVAGANKAANIGTAIHSFAERLDLGQDLGVIPPEYLPDIKAYEQTTKILNNKFIEQFSVLDKYKIAGTPDRVVEYNGELFIADIKTGRIDHPNNISIQLAIYANGLPYDAATATRGSWGEVNKEKAIIIHLPAGTGSCKLMWIDIKEGFKGLQFAMKARKWRDQKGLSYPFEQENK